MRVSPVAGAFDTLNEVLKEAERTALAIAGTTFLARSGSGKSEVEAFVTEELGFSSGRDHGFQFCQALVPPAFDAILESDGFEVYGRRALDKGGDSDTRASMAGAIAGAFYSVPDEIAAYVLGRLDSRLRLMVYALKNQSGIGFRRRSFPSTASGRFFATRLIGGWYRRRWWL
jgi:ADP-ribosylglycohydrolase